VWNSDLRSPPTRLCPCGEGNALARHMLKPDVRSRRVDLGRFDGQARTGGMSPSEKTRHPLGNSPSFESSKEFLGTGSRGPQLAQRSRPAALAATGSKSTNQDLKRARAIDSRVWAHAGGSGRSSESVQYVSPMCSWTERSGRVRRSLSKSPFLKCGIMVPT